MIVKMSCVQMCGNDDFKPLAPEPICKLNAHTVRRLCIGLICYAHNNEKGTRRI